VTIRLIVFVGACVLLAACGSDGKPGGVDAAEQRVKTKEKAVADAQATFDSASAKFCTDAKDYIAALDRYGKAFEDSAVTVGDVKDAGADLAKPRSDVTSAAQDASGARESLETANHELAEAEADLAAARAEASSVPAPPSSGATTTTTTLVPQATIDRVNAAEADFAAAGEGITDATPLARATAEFNSAAFALEVAWLRVLSDAGCLSDEQQVAATKAVQDYTASLQTALKTAGYYTGNVDGIYGPSTIEAVKKLQTASQLPATGYVDQATEAALNSVLASKGGAVATQALANTAAVQSTLKLAGYWTGPIDGEWTPELTDALKKLQADLGVPATGAVDTATLDAVHDRIADAKASSASTTTSSTVAGG
jgi:peptidoglycan hydrolase-like protein with peptidoglycan-binding domain